MPVGHQEQDSFYSLINTRIARLTIMKIALAWVSAVIGLIAMAPLFFALHEICSEALSDFVCAHNTKIKTMSLRCDCSNYPHLDDKKSCSLCQIHPSKGQCGFDSTDRSLSVPECRNKWHGPLCEQCNSVNQHDCTGACQTNYYGEQCKVKCDSTVCSNHGDCDSQTGKCICHNGYFTPRGSATQCQSACPKVCDDQQKNCSETQLVPCSAKGVCNSGVCECFEGFFNGVKGACEMTCNCNKTTEFCNPLKNYKCTCNAGLVRNGNECTNPIDDSTTPFLAPSLFSKCIRGTCGTRGRCNFAKDACVCDNQYKNHDGTIKHLFHVIDFDSGLPRFCNSTEALFDNEVIEWHSEKRDSISPEHDYFFGDEEGNPHPHNLRKKQSSVNKFELMTEPGAQGHNWTDAALLCSNTETCKGVVKHDNKYALVKQSSGEETPQSEVYEMDMDSTFECPDTGKVYIYKLNRILEPCFDCQNNWGPAPGQAGECTRFCDSNTCNGHGQCDPSTFQCNCNINLTNIPNNALTQKWDPETNCKFCLRGFHDETKKFNCSVPCNDVDCNQQMAAGVCSRNTTILQNTFDLITNQSDPMRRACKCFGTYRTAENCHRTCEDASHCNYHGECSGSVCVCNTGFFGPKCEFSCPDFFFRGQNSTKSQDVTNYTLNGIPYDNKSCNADEYARQCGRSDATEHDYVYCNENNVCTKATNVKSSSCNFGACQKLTTYVHENKTFSQTPCTKRDVFTNCSCDAGSSVSSCIRNRIFCDNGLCTKVGCKCSLDFFSGDACHIEGCPLHTFEHPNDNNIKSPCGENPPDDNKHCSRGECIPVGIGPEFGLEGQPPAESISAKNQGICKCRTSTNKYLNSTYYGYPEFTEKVCMNNIEDNVYVGGSCQSECTCNSSQTGVCEAIARPGCRCRQNPEKQTLFTGFGCNTPCDGLCRMNEEGNECNQIEPAFEGKLDVGRLMNKISEDCPCAQGNCKKTVSHQNCYTNIYPCNRAGKCSDTCKCYRVPQEVMSIIRFNFPLVLAETADCSHKCPHSNSSEWHDLIESYENNEQFLSKAISYVRDTDIQTQETKIIQFAKKYKQTVCSGHGMCLGELSLKVPNMLKCRCDSSYGGFDCAQLCEADESTIQYFESIGITHGSKVAQAASNFGISVCGSHAVCAEILSSGSVKCVPRGADSERFDINPALGHFYAHGNFENAAKNLRSKLPPESANKTVRLYRPFFVGNYSECLPNHFTEQKLLTTEAAIKEMPEAVRWQHERTCDVRCVQNSKQLPAQANGNLVTARIATHCCQSCFEDDWANYPLYGGCKTCMHIGANASDQCKTCTKKNAQERLDLPCAVLEGASNAHCATCRENFEYPEVMSGKNSIGEGTYPACVPCIKGQNGQVCSGHGRCQAEKELLTGTCVCQGPWSGPSCATSNICENGVRDKNGFCVCSRSTNPSLPNFGGLDCKTEHFKGQNPIRTQDQCLVIHNNGVRTICANKGFCNSAKSCTCVGHYNASLRCTELNDNVVDIYKDLICQCGGGNKVGNTDCSVGGPISLLTTDEACNELDILLN